jgi:hypothetical protein
MRHSKEHIKLPPSPKQYPQIREFRTGVCVLFSVFWKTKTHVQTRARISHSHVIFGGWFLCHWKGPIELPPSPKDSTQIWEFWACTCGLSSVFLENKNACIPERSYLTNASFLWGNSCPTGKSASNYPPWHEGETFPKKESQGQKITFFRKNWHSECQYCGIRFWLIVWSRNELFGAGGVPGWPLPSYPTFSTWS